MKYKNMNILCQNAYNMLKNTVSEESTVVCALGGGADSGVLVSIMKHLSEKIGFKLVAIHINHQLSEHSSSLEDAARKQAAEQKVTFFHLSVDVIRTKSGIESDARVARFKAIHSFMDMVNATHLALGHTATDAAETLFQRLMEGSGRGLGAMPSVNGKIIRPLISMTREKIRNLAISNNIHFMDDPMNFDKTLLRVLLREQIFPILKENNNNIERNMARASQYAFEMSQFLEEEAKKQWFCVNHKNIYQEKMASTYISATTQQKIVITTAIRQMIEEISGETVRGGGLETEKIYQIFEKGKNPKKFFIGKALIEVNKGKINVFYNDTTINKNKKGRNDQKESK